MPTPHLSLGAECLTLGTLTVEIDPDVRRALAEMIRHAGAGGPDLIALAVWGERQVSAARMAGLARRVNRALCAVGSKHRMTVGARTVAMC